MWLKSAIDKDKMYYASINVWVLNKKYDTKMKVPEMRMCSVTKLEKI